MGQAVAVRGASAALRLTRDSVLLLQMKGLLTKSAIAELAGVAMNLHGASAIGFVVDYRPGLFLASPADLGALLRQVPADSPMRRPGAFVGTLGMKDILMAHAMGMAEAGFRRRVFIDVPTAYSWVLARARGERFALDD